VARIRTHVIVQICLSRLLAVCMWGERSGDDGRSMRLLTHPPAGSTPRSRAEPGGEGTGFGPLQRPSLIATRSSESSCRSLPSAQCFASLRAGMVPPNPGLRAGASRTVRPLLGSADHATSRQAQRLARSPRPERSRRRWPTLTRSPEQRHGHSRTRRLPSTSTTDVDMRYSNRRTRNLSSAAGAGPRRQPRSGGGVWAMAFGRA
jgi:hypothetical protein